MCTAFHVQVKTTQPYCTYCQHRTHEVQSAIEIAMILLRYNTVRAEQFLTPPPLLSVCLSLPLSVSLSLSLSLDLSLFNQKKSNLNKSLFYSV